MLTQGNSLVYSNVKVKTLVGSKNDISLCMQIQNDMLLVEM